MHFRRVSYNLRFRMDEPRLTLPNCRSLIGSQGQGFSDEELERARDQIHAIAAIIVDAFEPVSRFDVTALNPPGIDEALRTLGWDLDISPEHELSEERDNG
jgi:hypothetical protein